MLRIALFSAALALQSCSFDPFVLQARAASVCQHLPAQRFQVPPAVRTQHALVSQDIKRSIEVERSFAFDVRAELPPEVDAMLETHFALTSVRITTVNAEDDLGFLDEAHVRIQPQTTNLEARTFDYVRTEEAPRTVSWSGESFELSEYLHAGTLAYSIALEGSLPPGDVIVDVEACAEAAVKLDAL